MTDPNSTRRRSVTIIEADHGGYIVTDDFERFRSAGSAGFLFAGNASDCTQWLADWMGLLSIPSDCLLPRREPKVKPASNGDSPGAVYVGLNDPIDETGRPIANPIGPRVDV